MRKRQRRLSGVDEIVLSLTAKGLTTGEISAHLAEVYGTSVSKDTISTITDNVVTEMVDWCNRPLDAVYPVLFIDAIHVKIRDGQVANRPIYLGIVAPSARAGGQSEHAGRGIIVRSWSVSPIFKLGGTEWSVTFGLFDQGVG